jgi:hypothetical protein
MAAYLFMNFFSLHYRLNTLVTTSLFLELLMLNINPLQKSLNGRWVNKHVKTVEQDQVGNRFDVEVLSG